MRELHDRGASLAAIEALVEGEQTSLTYHFLLDGKSERLSYPQADGHWQSLIQLYGSADYMERSLNRRYHIKFVGNPNLEQGL